MKKLPDYYVTKLDLNEAMEEQDEKMKTYRDEVLTGIDGVMKELQDMREENAAATLHFDRLDETDRDHEKRIKHLETAKHLT